MTARRLVRFRRIPGVFLATSLLVPLLPAEATAGAFDARIGASTRQRQRANIERLHRFTERRDFEARARRLNVTRDADRRAEARRLRRAGTPAEVAAFRRRIEREDAVDELRLRTEAERRFEARERARLERWWDSLGPVTRRNLVRSRLELRRTTREAEQDVRLRELEREAEKPKPDPTRPFERRPGLP